MGGAGGARGAADAGAGGALASQLAGGPAIRAYWLSCLLIFIAWRS